MKFKLSRNAPCPCNSEKKYKKCCMGTIPEEQEAYYGLLHVEGTIKDKLMRWVGSNFTQDELNIYAHEFNEKSFEEMTAESESTINFFDWFFLESWHKEENKKMLDVIIDDSPEFFRPEELLILREWNNNTQSGIFEVKETNQEKWNVLLKELFTGKEYGITDKKASEYLVRGDVIFSRVQNIFSEYYLSGAVTNYSRFSVLEELKEFVTRSYDQAKKHNKKLTYEEFMNTNSKLLMKFSPQEPTFITGTGDVAKMCEAIYSFDADTIEEILDWFDGEEGFVFTDEQYDGEKLKSADIVCVKSDGKSSLDQVTGEIVLMNHYIDEDGNKIEAEAYISVKDNKLTVFSSSEKAFAKVCNALDKNLGNHLTQEKKEIKDTEEALEEFKREGKKEQVKDPKLAKVHQRLMERYYRDWCDQKIPMLENKTPRQAIKTKKGRDMVNKFILDCENDEQHKKRDGDIYVAIEKVIREELDF